jgi:predicted O-methyltransferase YrrM
MEMLLDSTLASLLDELSAFGTAYDGDEAHRPGRMLNITPDTGAFLAVLVKATGSTGRVTTVELAPAKVAMARANFARAGLAGRIAQREGDAAIVLAGLDDGAFDLLFLDSLRSAYLAWWPDLKRVLRPGGLLVVDNACSHPEDMAGFTAAVRADGGFTTSLVPVGKGEFLAVKG